MSLSVHGLSSSIGTGYGAVVRSSAALRAQLAQAQKQLSDCVNCASSSTPEAQKQIQVLSSRIASLQAQIADVPAQPSQVAPAPAGPDAKGPGPGRLLDVYA